MDIFSSKEVHSAGGVTFLMKQKLYTRVRLRNYAALEGLSFAYHMEQELCIAGYVIWFKGHMAWGAYTVLGCQPVCTVEAAGQRSCIKIISGRRERLGTRLNLDTLGTKESVLISEVS